MFFLIEDLAQSFGGKDAQGTLLGTKADIIVGSFGRDKIIDGVSGGFLLLASNHTNDVDRLDTILSNRTVGRKQVVKDLSYPLITHYFRKWHPSLFSKLLLFLGKKAQIVTTPLAAPKKAYSLPNEHAALALFQLENLSEQLDQRRKIAEYFFNELKTVASVQLPVTLDQIKYGTNLRFPLFVADPDNIIALCKKENMHISDRWYRSPVDCSTLDCVTVYRTGDCPNAEYASKHILNLPTHMYVTKEHTKKLVGIIKKYA